MKKNLGKEMTLAYLTLLVHILDSEKKIWAKRQTTIWFEVEKFTCSRSYEVMEQRLLFQFSKRPLIK